MSSAAKLLLFDCDSTLSAIEGVDELARMRGPGIFKAVEDMTNAAMNGGTALRDVFARRLDMIRPNRAMCSRIAKLYDEHATRGLADTLATVRAAGWRTVVVSGGFTPAIEPFAKKHGFGRLEAVDLKFDKKGDYAGFDLDAPTARNGGKPEIVEKLRRENIGATVVMIGDGASDLECKGVADLFVGFGGFVERPKVRDNADVFIRSLAELPAVLAKL